MRYLLVGNYGVGNLGDEMLREYFLNAFPEIDWTVISPAQGDLPRLPFGVRSLLQTPWWKSLFALRKSDGMVFGGGTLLTDVESIKAPLLWWWHAMWAWIFGKKIILAFQGIGPFDTRVGGWCSRWVVEHAEVTIVRDGASFRRISPWKNKKCVQSFDPVIRIFTKDFLHSGEQRTKKVFILIPRANSTSAFMASAREMLLKAGSDHGAVRILSLERESSRERETCQALAREWKASIATPGSFEELREALRDASFVVTQRYHGAVMALGMGIPFVAIPQKEGDKLATIAGVHRDEAMRLLKAGEAALRTALHGER